MGISGMVEREEEVTGSGDWVAGKWIQDLLIPVFAKVVAISFSIVGSSQLELEIRGIGESLL